MRRPSRLLSNQKIYAPKRLLEQFIGQGTSDNAVPSAQDDRCLRSGSGLGGIAGGLAADGLLGMLLGNKKARKKVGKLASGVVGYGGAAALGALGYRAYQNWQAGKPVSTVESPPVSAPAHAEGKAFVFDTLGNPPSLQDIASLVSGPEQAAEIYLVSRLAIDPDHPAEIAYLDALASRLSLPSELVAHLESQAVQAT